MMMLKKIQYFLLTKSIGFYLNILSFTFPEKAQKMGAFIFSKPRKGKLDGNQLPKVLENAIKETLYFGDHTFQSYLWKGDSEVILLIHGWESNSSRWKKTLPYLKKTGKTIVAIDGPAHGLSSGNQFNVPLYTEFMEVAVKRFCPTITIGHSIGGATCIFHQHKYPNLKLKKMVLLGAPSDLKIILNNYVDLLSLNSKNHDLLEDYFKNKFKITMNDFSGAKFAAKMTIKSFIAHDKNDKIVLFTEGQKLANAFPNADFVDTETLGHSLHDDELYRKLSLFIVKE